MKSRVKKNYDLYTNQYIEFDERKRTRVEVECTISSCLVAKDSANWRVKKSDPVRINPKASRTHDLNQICAGCAGPSQEKKKTPLDVQTCTCNSMYGKQMTKKNIKKTTTNDP